MENIYLDLNLHTNSSEDPSIQHSQKEFIIHVQTPRYSFDLVLHLLSAVSFRSDQSLSRVRLFATP